ncbi:MAG: ATP-dependent 6-phosphofructokinase [Elusimicrobiales bacterium]|nr:ATP-dependent 6-phosphofructokinase [Elusimicrobiales bacterium]
MKIGILTGGGDCPGLNAVVRGVTKSALMRGWEVIGFKEGFRGFTEGSYLPLGDHDVSGIIIRGGTILGTSNVANPFSYTLPPYGTPEHPADLTELVKDNFKKLKLDALVAIGGDGTLSMAKKIHDLGLPIVGVPKTIDNDLSATDVTFGFDSALTIATEAVDRVHSTAESHNRVMIVETMGRYAGWIALRAGIAGGGDIILLPEIPYKEQEIVDAVLARKQKGKKFSIIVVSEGARPVHGEMTSSRIVKGSPDPLRLGGVSYKIADLLDRANIGMESRVVVLGHVQRGGEPTPFDRWLATGFGVCAAELIAEKKFGRMASFRSFGFTSVSLADAVGKLHLVSPDSQEVRIAASVGTSFGNSDMVKPF